MSLRLLASATLAVGLLAAPAVAQDQQPAKPAPPKPAAGAPAPTPGNSTPAISGPQPDWVKLCSTDPQSEEGHLPDLSRSQGGDRPDARLRGIA